MYLLEKLNDKDIIFTGFIPEEEKRLLLAESSRLVQPSLYEGFGNPPLEAMLSGTQALVSDIPVFREAYGDFPVNFFRAGDSKDLAAKIRTLFCDKEEKRLILPAGLRKKYSFNKIVSILLKEMVNP
jgi:glycosyltransferase involved in cell wall biosynthesis